MFYFQSQEEQFTVIVVLFTFVYFQWGNSDMTIAIFLRKLSELLVRSFSRSNEYFKCCFNFLIFDVYIIHMYFFSSR